MALSGVNVFGVALLNGGGAVPMAPATLVIPYREIGAVARRAPYVRPEMSDSSIAEYHQVVCAVFRHHTILPAPVGLMFRSTNGAARWLEMNYVALAEGVRFLEGRCEVRVHIADSREPLGDTPAADADGADAAVLAAECFQALRRFAVAAVPLREHTAQRHVLRGAFLIERSSSDDFIGQICEQMRRHGELRLAHSGPWPPYDFVRIDVGT